MKFWLSLILILFLALFFYLLPQPEPKITANNPPHNSFVIGPVQLFDGTNWHPEHFVEVQDGWIKQWHSSEPDSKLPRVAGQNGWLVPGLIDAHVHIASFTNDLQQNLHFGVTTVLDQFSPADLLKSQQAQHLSTERTEHADMFGAGILATTAGGHGTQYGFAIPMLSSPEEAEAFVMARKAEGSNWIKIVYRGEKARKVGQPSLDLATVSALIQAAHRQGLMALVHIEDHQSALEVIKAGADGLVHGFYDAPVSDALIDAMQANNSFIIPTLVVMEGFLQQQINQQLLYKNQPAWLTSGIKNQLKQRLNFGVKNPQAFAQLQRNIKRLYDAGIPVLVGTDAPNPNTAAGVSVVVEMVLLQQAGLSAEAVLHSTTGLTGQIFQLPAHGHLQPGAKADFMLLAADPREDLTALWQPLGIWKHGWQHTPFAETESETLTLRAGVIADFRQSEQALQGSFLVSDDRIMLGKSFAERDWQPEQSMQVRGAIRAGVAYPWAGLSWQLGETTGQGRDLSSLQQLRFRIRGTPGWYRLDAFHLGSWVPHSQKFRVTEQWQWVTLSIADFEGLDTSKVKMFSWIGPEGDFAFELERIEAD